MIGAVGVDDEVDGAGLRSAGLRAVEQQLPGCASVGAVVDPALGLWAPLRVEWSQGCNVDAVPFIQDDPADVVAFFESAVLPGCPPILADIDAHTGIAGARGIDLPGSCPNVPLLPIHGQRTHEHHQAVVE